MVAQVSDWRWSHKNNGERVHPLKIFELLLAGVPMNEAAEQLGVSYSAVKQRVERALIVFGVHDVVELVNLFLLPWEHPLSARRKYLP
jgi:hypothetical protein